ncbi:MULTISPECIES: TolC family outer membrane protein [Acinetobacter]|uniref:TolC family outer membrane protein n=1 Tax=Acinetobacter tibetensis TaxID=2943497 RepID=A0AAE9LRH5_9GAMM|nr:MULTISPECIES: TolC family outer membrane protein [Acinetobacter]PWB13137.1 RND transporter [Acinetobacter sp. AM]USE83056.1 TolC family outer membrane protein [Acinetobacter tibetensis]
MKKLWLLGLSLSFHMAEAHALDLVQAYARAQQTDPNWQANKLQYEADQLNLGIAKGNLLPTITVSASSTRKSQQNSDTSQSSLEIPSATTTHQVAVTARQPLFRWDAWEGFKQVETSVNLSEVTLKLQQQQHILTVAESYFDVLRQQSLTQAYLQEEQALLQQLNMMNAKLREGLVAKSDVSEAQAQYQNARANRIATQVQLLLAQEQLQQLIGPYRDKLAVIRDDFVYQKPHPAQLTAWEDLARSHNLEIQQARLQQRYAEDQKRVEKAALYPQLEAVGTYGYNQQQPSSVLSNDGQFDQIGIEMNWNAFTGGRTQRSIQKAAVNVRKSEAQLDAAIRKAQTEVKKAYYQVETDQAKLEARQAAMQSSQVVSEASQAQYQEGLKTMVDVLLAQRNAFSTKQDYVNAKYDYVLNVLRLKAAVGQLNEQALQQMNVWLVEK